LSNTCIVPTGTGTNSSIPPIIPRKPGDRWNKLRDKKNLREYTVPTVPYFQKLGLNVAALFLAFDCILINYVQYSDHFLISSICELAMSHKILSFNQIKYIDRGSHMQVLRKLYFERGKKL
jgi:hypothetical protein